jgi:hypothetical protein
MRDVLLLVGFVVCVALGAVTVLWPELSSHDDAPPPQSSPQPAVP